MSNEIIVVEKTDCISWNDIHEVLWAAHETTRQMGIYYPTSEMTGDELEEFIRARNGRCYVAMDGDKVVGTVSCYVENVHTRLFRGKFLSLALSGIIPQYKGKQIFSKLYNVCYNYAKSAGLKGMIYGTAEKNYTMRRIFENKGFVYYRCSYNKKKKRFVVGGIYCFDKLPHGKTYYALIFKLKQMLAHVRYTTNKIRFGI